MESIIKIIIKSFFKQQVKFNRNFKRSFIAGTMGYLVFLFTLATSYWLTSKPFRYGLTRLDEKDLLLSLTGFIAFSAVYVVNELNKNDFHG